MAIRRVIKIAAKPTQGSGLLEEFERLVPIFRQESGCQDYSLFQSVEDPNEFLVVDLWDSLDSYEGHLRLEREMGLDFTGFLAEPMRVERYES